MEEKKLTGSGGTCGQGGNLFFPPRPSSSSSSSSLNSPAVPPDRLSVDIIPDSANANDMGGLEEGACLDSLPSSPPPPPPPPFFLLLSRLLLLLFPGRSRSGLASRCTLRNPGHGVSLGKQRPGQQGFTRALIILRAISGGSPELYTLLGLLSLRVHSPRWLKKMNSFFFFFLILLWNSLHLKERFLFTLFSRLNPSLSSLLFLNPSCSPLVEAFLFHLSADKHTTILLPPG